MRKVERGERIPRQRDIGGTGAQEWEQLQQHLSYVGQVVSKIDQALDRAAAVVSPLLDAPRRPKAHLVFAQACWLYEETVAAVTHTRQQLFDLPMLVTFLAHAPPEESTIALRRLEQYCRGLHGIEEALDAAATHVVQTWYETRTNGQGEETTRGY
jgi:hypothetical protein